MCQFENQGSHMGFCCSKSRETNDNHPGISRRSFLGGLGGAALGGLALTGLSWPFRSTAEAEAAKAPERKPLVVKPIFTYNTYSPRHQTSWRPWGGVRTQEDAHQEIQRIQGELKKLQSEAEFPMKMLPLSAAQNRGDVAKLEDAKTADALLVYACDGRDALHGIQELGKDTIFFVRWRSGPVYLWYEIIHPRYLRSHSDHLALKGMDFQDVVVDDQDEILWRLRALMGLKNFLKTRIVAVGGPGGWATPNAPQLAKDRFQFDIRTATYDELRKLIQEARKDGEAVELAKKQAADYLNDKTVSLETEKIFVENAFLLERVFKDLMAKADCHAITINQCMGTIMPASETTACLPLTTLNDAGFLAFCESDFVVIPAGVLLSNISGKPMFFCNPTFPHKGEMTYAHCTAPRKMDGKNLEPVRIVTHMESDYGAAPKVEMRKGQKLTLVNPDFEAQRWMGLEGEIIDAPFKPICRSQIDVKFQVDSDLLAENMRGFHWMIVYGDYLREVGYALKKTDVKWKLLS